MWDIETLILGDNKWILSRLIKFNKIISLECLLESLNSSRDKVAVFL